MGIYVKYWSTREKKIIWTSITSTEAIEKYFEAYPDSERSKSSIYTYWWWRHHPDTTRRNSDNMPARADIEPGDYVRYSRGSKLLSPIGIVIGMLKSRDKMKVWFDTYNMRDVYCCDYTVVIKGVKNDS
jgi:hypothetical protein